jgi:hypothetical protein
VGRRPLQHALDEIRFGPTGTLNLRASLPSGAEAVKRAESWLRMKQAEGAREVLIVTGRGNHSFARVPVVRDAVRRLLGLLSTRGVVIDHSEHSPGSFAVRLAPLSASVQRRPAGDADAASPPALLDPPTLDGLSAATRDRLRLLATGTLHSLGIADPSPDFVRDEMTRQCALLAASLPPVGTALEREQRLHAAILRALEALDDDQR